ENQPIYRQRDRLPVMTEIIGILAIYELRPASAVRCPQKGGDSRDIRPTRWLASRIQAPPAAISGGSDEMERSVEPRPGDGNDIGLKTHARQAPHRLFHLASRKNRSLHLPAVGIRARSLQHSPRIHREETAHDPAQREDAEDQAGHVMPEHHPAMGGPATR